VLISIANVNSLNFPKHLENLFAHKIVVFVVLPNHHIKFHVYNYTEHGVIIMSLLWTIFINIYYPYSWNLVQFRILAVILQLREEDHNI
jgi:hypothetical protein